jgi:hypothetical protein
MVVEDVAEDSDVDDAARVEASAVVASASAAFDVDAEGAWYGRSGRVLWGSR